MHLKDAMSRTHEIARAKRNSNPHGPAVIAMTLWSGRYAAQNGGSMDFWDTLREAEKDQCRRIFDQIIDAPGEQRR